MASIREQLRFRDIDWMMPDVDARQVMIRLGANPRDIKVIRGELITFCPDHHLFVGKESSDPNWIIDLKTGGTYCRTEGRGSNLVFTVSRVLDCTPTEAYEWILGDSAEVARADSNFLKNLPSDVRLSDEDGESPLLDWIHSIKGDMEKGYITSSGRQFFMSPPGKAPTNISLETLRHYKVFERTWGWYHDRLIIPFSMRKELVGFAAIDKFGQKEWLRRNPMAVEKDYSKVLFSAGIKTRDILFGYDDVSPNCPYLILTEGPREVMKLWQEGYPNTVALFGVNLYGGQLEAIANLCPQSIIIMLDGDVAGQRASVKIGEKIKEMFNTYVAVVPDGKDPKVLSSRELKPVIRHAVSVESFKKGLAS